MATSKTLAPTNVTISIPALVDIPDASVFSNCIDKEADAINALNSQLTNIDQGRVWTTSNYTLESFLQEIETIIGDKVGFMSLGFMQNQTANAIGAPFAGYLVAYIRQSSSTKLIRLVDFQYNGADIASICRTGSDGWQTEWQQGNILFSVGKAIPSGSDLNNYTDMGSWYSSNATNSATLSHCPYTAGGFRLLTIPIASSSRMQFVIPNTSLGKFYMRRYGGTAWDNGWYEFSGTLVT